MTDLGHAGPRLTTIAPMLEGWRAAARALLREEVPPAAVLWREAEDAQLALEGLVAAAPGVPPRHHHAPGSSADHQPDRAPIAAGPPDAARVPRRFLELATLVACHADAARWALLYRVLWRLVHGEPHLMHVSVDADVLRLLRMEKAVRRDVHKTHAFVRFRRVDDAEPGGEPGSPDGTRWIAWFAPAHDTLALSAPFFARRFPNMRWSILSPRRSVHWDGRALVAGPGMPRDAAPEGDALEAAWRTYYASIFNPARVRPRAMMAEMPKAFWRDLPEASIIPELVADAPRRVREMLEREARDATRRGRKR